MCVGCWSECTCRAGEGVIPNAKRERGREKEREREGGGEGEKARVHARVTCPLPIADFTLRAGLCLTLYHCHEIASTLTVSLEHTGN